MLDFNTITELLLVGTCPMTRADVATLREHDVKAVMNLQSDRDLATNGIVWSQLTEQYERAGIAHSRYPMVDFDEDNIQSLLGGAIARLEHTLGKGQRTYLHCNAGRERSPTVAAGWLMQHGGFDLDGAVQHLLSIRPSNPYIFMLEKL